MMVSLSTMHFAKTQEKPLSCGSWQEGSRRHNLRESYTAQALQCTVGPVGACKLCVLTLKVQQTLRLCLL